MAKLDDKIHKEVDKARKRFGGSFDEAMFISTNNRVLELTDRKKQIGDRLAKAMTDGNMEELRQIIVDCEIADPESGSRNWTEVRQFNLMFSTKLGSVADAADTIYLRPETAQGIFVNFLNVQKTTRQKVPFGIAQIGKAFRNGSWPDNSFSVCGNSEQMEMQYFVRPGEEDNWYSYWKEHRMKWHKAWVLMTVC